MYLIIVFTLVIALVIYIGWGQSDDFCFFIVLALLSTVLYILSKDARAPNIIESFAQATNNSGSGSGNSGAVAIDLAAFAKLKELKRDTLKVLQPKFINFTASLKGSYKPEQEQKYDDQGNEVEQKVPDEVPTSDAQIRVVNKLMHDLRKYDAGCYYHLLALAKGKTDKVVEEEYTF